MKRMANTVPPNDGSEWGHLSDAELLKKMAGEFARRRAARGELDLNAIEEAIGLEQREFGEDALAATIESLPPEDGTSKACPKCGGLVRVKNRNRVRHLMTYAGELRLSRNYHYCKRCQLGFYPRDIQLNLPEEGEVSDAMDKRILDFAMNASFEEAGLRSIAQLEAELSPAASSALHSRAAPADRSLHR